MKKVFLLLFVFLFASSSWAAPRVDLKALQMGLNQQVRSARPTDPLAKYQNPANWKTITWQEFLKRNKELQTKILQVERKETLDLANHANDFDVIPCHHNTYPDYQKLTAGYSLIYLEESLNHQTKAVPAEAAKILGALRKKNPKAKILLAEEFMVWYGDRDSSVLKKAKAKTQNYSVYKELEKAADEANIDQLALDDYIFQIEKNGFKYKIGAQWVFIPWKEVWTWVEQKYPFWTELNEDRMGIIIEHFRDMISVSPWGVLERNRQWANYILALQKQYDIVVVYGGDGHISGVSGYDVTNLVGQSDYLQITLRPLEDLPPELDFYFQNRAQEAECNNITINNKLAEEYLAQQKIIEDKIACSFSWDDPSKPLWALASEEIIMKDEDQFEEEDKNSIYPKEILTVTLPGPIEKPIPPVTLPQSKGQELPKENIRHGNLFY